MNHKQDTLRLVEAYSQVHAPLDVDQIEIDGVEGIDREDYPDFVDAYISSALYPDGAGGFRDLTPEELEWLNTTHPEIAQQKAYEKFSGM